MLTEDMVANILIKPLRGELFRRLRTQLLNLKVHQLRGVGSVGRTSNVFFFFHFAYVFSRFSFIGIA